jgi:hypothetical protein
MPQHLAAGGIECHDIAIDARRRVHHAINDQGLTCIVPAGRGPKFRADQRHATRRSRTLAALI